MRVFGVNDKEPSYLVVYISDSGNSVFVVRSEQETEFLAKRDDMNGMAGYTRKVSMAEVIIQN